MPYKAPNDWSSARQAVRLVVLAFWANCALSNCLTHELSLALANEAGVSPSLLSSDVITTDPSPSDTGPIVALPPQTDVEASSVVVIDGRDIACRAARNWAPAKALRMRGETVTNAYAEQDECLQQAARIVANFLHQQACYQEDIGAASALRAYYARIAIQEQLQLAERSLEFMEHERDKHLAAFAKGLSTGTDLTSFDRRRLEIEDQQLQLRSQDHQLRALLSQIAQTDYDPDMVRQELLDVRPSSLDCQQLQILALTMRCDLHGWSSLAQQTTETTAPLIGQMLTTAVGGFGLPLPTISKLKALVCPPDMSCFVASLQQELTSMAEAHRSWIRQTVEEKCLKLQLAYQRIELAQATMESWDQRLAQLQKLQELGDRAAEEHAAARIGLLQAEADDIARRLEARSAEIDLAEAIGGLSRRCCAGQAWLMTGRP